MILRTSLTALGALAISACAATPGPYVTPRGLEFSDAPARNSTLEGSKPSLTVECHGDLATPDGEVCLTRVAGHPVHGVRNIAVPNAEAIAEFGALERDVITELGPPTGRWVYVATQQGKTPDYPSQNCQFEAIRTSVPGLAEDSAEAAAAAAAGSLCMHAEWQTPTENVRVMLATAATSALDGPGLPTPELAGHYAVRLFRGRRDKAVEALYLDARLNALSDK